MCRLGGNRIHGPIADEICNNKGLNNAPAEDRRGCDHIVSNFFLFIRGMFLVRCSALTFVVHSSLALPPWDYFRCRLRYSRIWMRAMPRRTIDTLSR